MLLGESFLDLFIKKEFKTLFDVWFGKSTNYSMLKVLGCPTYYHVDGGNIEPKTKKRVLVSYGERAKR